MKGYKYVNSTMEYYYFGEFYIRIHEPSFPTSIGNYALIQSSKTFANENEFEYLKKNNLLTEITKEEFLEQFERANLIFKQLLAK